MSDSEIQSAAEFYDTLSSDYDAMIGFQKRIVSEEPIFRELVNRYSVTNALDAGCGTGFHSVLLSRLGVDVIGVDVSARMLERARKNALEFGSTAQFVQSDFLTLPTVINERFDAVFCLGNSLAHLLSDEDLAQSLLAFSSLLRNDGTLFIQILNYGRILSRRERIQSVKEEGDSVFVRFYDFFPGYLQFNLLKLQRTSGILNHSIRSVRLRPVRVGGLQNSLRTAGLKDIAIFADTHLSRFDPQESTDAFLVATKQELS